MALYAIGDTHLSLNSDKPMDFFGGEWENYINKLREGFSALKEDDVCVICGDISWAMDMEEAKEDFKFLAALPGKKIILKGNHDYWWTTASKAKKFFLENDITGIDFLHNNCHFYNDIAICGTRGWFYEEETHNTEHDRKIMNRELMRLEASLKCAGDARKYCFLHYPPRFRGYISEDTVALLKKYGVQRCYYGHIHGKGHHFALEGLYDGVDYKLVSADYIRFSPIKICD